MFGRSSNKISNAYGRSKRVAIKNTETEMVPPFACCEVIDMEDRSYGDALFHIAKPSANVDKPGMMVLNTEGSVYGSANPRPFGTGTRHMPAQVIVEASASVAPGDTVGPISGEWFMGVDGTGFVVFAEDKTLAVDDATYKSIWVESTGGGSGGGAGIIQGTISSISTISSGQFMGLIAAQVSIEVISCGETVSGSVQVIDHSGCVFDLPEADLQGLWCWAHKAESDSGDCHWAAIDRCCAPGEGSSGGS